MNRRLRNLVRAGAASGLLLFFLGGLGLAQRPEPMEPLPGPDWAGETIDLLAARDSGALEVEARGAGDDRVALRMRNTSPKRLHVVIPPGLVASAAAGQFQSMGLGMPGNAPEAFGRFESASGAPAAFQSLPLESIDERAITIPSGQELALHVSAVCLNHGLPDPEPRDRFELMDVGAYTDDARIQRALRSLATLGTDRRVAQVVMWHVCDGLSLPQIARRSPRIANRWEYALASRFIDALDTSSGATVDPAYLQARRVFVRVQADERLAAEADRLAEEIRDSFVLGMPVQVVGAETRFPVAEAPALYLVVTLTAANEELTVGRVAAHGLGLDGGWTNGGVAKLTADSPLESLRGPALAAAVDRAVAREFVRVTEAGRSDSGVTFRIENGLPMTLANMVLEASGAVPFEAIGVGPLRAVEVEVPAYEAEVQRVELNGL